MSIFRMLPFFSAYCQKTEHWTEIPKNEIEVCSQLEKIYQSYQP